MFNYLKIKYYMNILTFLFFVFSYSCTEKNADTNNTEKVTGYDKEAKVSVKLPKKLQELSGLAMTSDGRLFGHNDEQADIFQIDYSDGSIIKSFSLGDKPLKKDFEGVAIANEMFYLVTSSGELYEFMEGKDGDSVPYKKYKTELSSKNDVEGLCYDPVNNSLLLACKGSPGKKYEGNRAVYSFSLSDKKLKKKPWFLISIEAVNKFQKSDFTQKLGEFFLVSENSFAPSGIERHPSVNSFYILSNHGRMIVQISEKGDINGVINLDKKHHNQPEGITFSPELTLIIGDEGGSGKAKITQYPGSWNK
jgi:uncharacterized protein YjiK